MQCLVHVTSTSYSLSFFIHQSVRYFHADILGVNLLFFPFSIFTPPFTLSETSHL